MSKIKVQNNYCNCARILLMAWSVSILLVGALFLILDTMVLWSPTEHQCRKVAGNALHDKSGEVLVEIRSKDSQKDSNQNLVGAYQGRLMIEPNRTFTCVYLPFQSMTPSNKRKIIAKEEIGEFRINRTLLYLGFIGPIFLIMGLLYGIVECLRCAYYLMVDKSMSIETYGPNGYLLFDLPTTVHLTQREEYLLELTSVEMEERILRADRYPFWEFNSVWKVIASLAKVSIVSTSLYACISGLSIFILHKTHTPITIIIVICSLFGTFPLFLYDLWYNNNIKPFLRVRYMISTTRLIKLNSHHVEEFLLRNIAAVRLNEGIISIRMKDQTTFQEVFHFDPQKNDSYEYYNLITQLTTPRISPDSFDLGEM